MGATCPGGHQADLVAAEVGILAAAPRARCTARPSPRARRGRRRCRSASSPIVSAVTTQSGSGCAREHREDPLRVADPPVEDQEARSGVGELDRVRVVDAERLREVVVRERLVGEPAALAVHHDRRRRAAAPLELRHELPVARDLRVEHDRRAPVRVEVGELRAGVDRHRQPVADVVRWTAAASRRSRCARARAPGSTRSRRTRARRPCARRRAASSRRAPRRRRSPPRRRR